MHGSVALFYLLTVTMKFRIVSKPSDLLLYLVIGFSLLELLHTSFISFWNNMSVLFLQEEKSITEQR